MLSILANPACNGDREKAERTVDEVFEGCFGDTRPFDEVSSWWSERSQTSQRTMGIEIERADYTDN